MNYKSGDLVKITGNRNHHQFSIGEAVRLMFKSRDEEWRAESMNGFSHWYVMESDMTPVKPATMPQKIIITTDGKTTLARLFDGKTMVKRAEAKCSPSDTFDFGVGAELAVKRLMGVEKPVVVNPITEPAKESDPVKLYCFKSCNNWLVKGRIYGTDKCGRFIYEDGDTTAEKFKCVDDIMKTWLGDCLVPLARRPAKVGEWVYVIDSTNEDVYRKNDVCEVVAENRGIRGKIDGVYIRTVSGKTLDCCKISGTAFLYDQEYLVLDGYTGDPA